MANTLLFTLVVCPFLAGLGIYFLQARFVRNLIILGIGGLLAASALALVGQGSFETTPGSILGISTSGLIMVADFALLGIMFYYGAKYKKPLIMALSGAQAILLAILEFILLDHGNHATFVCDKLSMVMVLVISFIGSAICIHAIPYMQKHEDHLHLEKTKQPRFFFILVAFLGAMNGLVLTNDLGFFYFFFEATTLCSFLLIGHDETEVATKNALWALLLNAVGGLALLIGAIWIYSSLGTMGIQEIINSGSFTGYLLFPLALICLAGFTKAAQVPFQSWLLGAMVAPTPTSALLHSSTMVKAGVYLVLRFAPAYAGTFLSSSVALVGTFTFLAAGALAIGQSNGKKVLAYSTVSNLGLIIACAGINTPVSITAAILLIIYHAISKGMLFLCVGTIEQRIASRDIEDMRGLWAEMPMTAMITVLGVLSMILPPFGMLLGKWMAIESSAGNIFVTVMLAFGSGITVLYWARWAGSLMNSQDTNGFKIEKQAILTRAPLVFLCASAIVLSVFSPMIYDSIIVPLLGTAPFEATFVGLSGSLGSYVVYPLFIVVGVSVFFGLKAMRRPGNVKVVGPYMSGVQSDDDPESYIGPMNAPVKVTASNYYLEAIFGEEKLTPWLNYGAVLLLLLMLGGSL